MNDSGFPGNSKFMYVTSPLDNHKESASSYVSTPDGLAVYSIWRYRTSDRANEKFWNSIKAIYPSKYVDWEVPNQIDVKDQNNDEFYIACGEDVILKNYRCLIISQYEEYFIRISIQMALDDLL